MLTGCALNRQADREIGEVLSRYERVQAAEARNYGALAGSSSETPPATEPAETVAPAPGSLAELIAVALECNPDVLAAIDTARSKAARVPQETALPDPMLMTKTLPEPVRTADGDNFFVLGVQQTLPVPGKLDARGRAALEEARMVIEELEQTRLRVIADVKRAYYQLYAIDETVAITRENQELLRDLIEVARAQLVAGRRAQEDVLRAQVEFSDLESQLTELRQRRTTTVALLNALLDRPPGTPIDRPPPYDIRRVGVQLERVLEHAAAANPELKRLERQIARDEQALRLARLAYWPDFTVGFEWMLMERRPAFQPPVDPQTGMRPPVNRMSEEGADSWAVMFGFNVPVWFERIEAGIREARHRLSASRRQHASAHNMVAYQVEDALARVRSFQEIAGLFATTIIPQAQQAYEVSRAGYVTGSADFQFVIDNWQKWLAFRIQYHRTLGELERSVADLEQVAGVSVVDMDGRPQVTGDEP